MTIEVTNTGNSLHTGRDYEVVADFCHAPFFMKWGIEYGKNP
jgi:hypothetical protein